MPSSINAYRQEIENALYNNPFVHEQKIFLDDRSEVWFLRGDVYFIDNSRLHFRELHIQRGQPYKKTYTYHYQKSNNELIFRYDNSPHYPHLLNAPHHKHINDRNIVSSSTPTLQQVLKEIETLISTD